jgi:hypothetical protein
MSGLDARQRPLGGRFEAVNVAIRQEDAGKCLHPLTMEGFSTKHFMAMRTGA